MTVASYRDVRINQSLLKYYNDTSDKVDILNISINNITCQDLLASLRNGGFVVTPNVDHLVKLQKDREFYDIYKDADYKVCDSKILMWISRFLGTPIKEKISGSDLFPAFYEYYKDDENIKIFLLGAAEGVAAKAQRNINAKAGRDIVIDTHSPYFGFENDEEECEKIVDLINKSEATVLAVGLGAPKQEKWIYKYKNQLHNIKIFLAIGATIDFESGLTSRAPKWLSEIGLEWFYRLISNPQRLWKRYLVESWLCLWFILQQKLNLYGSM